MNTKGMRGPGYPLEFGSKASKKLAKGIDRKEVKGIRKALSKAMKD